MSEPRTGTPPPRLRFSLLGHPVRHSVSPAMCSAAFASMGMSHLYTAIDVPGPAGLGRIADDLRQSLGAEPTWQSVRGRLIRIARARMANGFTRTTQTIGA